MKNTFLILILFLFSGCIAEMQDLKGTLDMKLINSDSNLSNKKITNIYIDHMFYGEYMLDFEKEELIILFGGHLYEDKIKRDFPIIEPLDAESIDMFFNIIKNISIEEWDNAFDNENIDGGHEWGIGFYFSDGTEIKSGGSNAYPETWDEMYDALEVLTGKPILLYRSDWMEKDKWDEEN